MRINLHLLNGESPSDNKNAEFVLSSFNTHSGNPGETTPQVTIFPNPMGRMTIVEILSSRHQNVEIGFMDFYQHLVRKTFLVELKRGSNRIEWDGTTDLGDPVAPGLYLVFIRDKSETRYFKILKIQAP